MGRYSVERERNLSGPTELRIHGVGGAAPESLIEAEAVSSWRVTRLPGSIARSTSHADGGAPLGMTIGPRPTTEWPFVRRTHGAVSHPN